jgi:environmental stress-induced protein Ves
MNAASGMRIIKAGDCRPMRWRNGGGETIEIAVSPEGATLADFDWRVSMARVETDGAFSTFPGVDRTLAILDGAGLNLTIDAQPPVELTASALPFSFDGAAAAAARLRDGPVLDLNLMTRRARFAHRMTRLSLTEPASVAVNARETFVLPAEGSLTVETEHGVVRLEPRDALHGHAISATWRLAPEGASRVYLLEIFDRAHA